MNFLERTRELETCLEITEWPARGSGGTHLETRGPYLLLKAPRAESLASAFREAAETKRTLLILPPSSPEEESRLLGRLPAIPPEEARLALFSSGTTGEPKVIYHSERSLLASAAQLARAFPALSSWACLLPSWGMAGIAFQFLLPLSLGGGRVFTAGESLLYWYERLDGLLMKEGAEILVLNPYQHAVFLRADSTEWKGTTLTLTAPMKAAQRASHLSKRPGPLREIYGMTEAAGPVLLDGISLGAELRLGQDGEVELKGPQLHLGAGGGWHPSGDIFENREGTWHFVSRRRELIDVGGRKVAPKLLEEIFEAMPELAECLAFGKEIQGIERPALLYVRKKGCTLPEEELSRKIEKRARESLSEDLRPVWWRESEELPRLPNGKPDRKSLA